jgi:DNA-binding IclR family transcriptional regulator
MALYIDQVESPATLRVNAQVGTMNPLHCTALGKILLAFGDTPIPSTLESHTSHTITDPRALQRELQNIRERGYAVDDEEFDQGIRCIAVPAMDYRGKLAGALGISGPSTRMTPERLPQLAASMVEIGRALSERLSFTHP